MARLVHDAVLRVVQPYGHDGGHYYFVMDFVHGGDLRKAVLAGTVAKEAIIPIVLRIGDALALAHRQGLVHRDVKPANILLDASGLARLTDFDLVGAADTTGGTRTGALGTFVYAAPELLDRPQDVDARADVYGLAMTAVFGLLGHELPTIVVRNPGAVIDGLPCGAPIKAVLKRAVEWVREARYPSSSAFCSALVAARLEAEPGRTPQHHR
jgi:serine/threonine-protein kinase